MGYEERPNTFTLFTNKKRSSNPKAPAVKGSGNIVINGITYDIVLAGWTKDSEKAGRYVSGTVKLKIDDEQYERRGTQAPADDSEIPF